MSTVSGGPNAVLDNLALYLDAANPVSYPGTGTAWTDLSLNRRGGTLVNGPTYSSSNLGSIVFDGTDDYVDFSASLGSTTIVTVEMWARIGAAYSGKMFFGFLRYDVWCGSGHLGYNTAVSDVYGISSTTVTLLGLVNNWKHYVFEMRSDVPYTNNKIYINGVSQSLSQLAGSENAADRNFNSGIGRLAAWRNDNTNFRMPMNCAIFKIYDRALTQQEVLQNFNAQRSRYGI
jgi:hypothetical protein